MEIHACLLGNWVNLCDDPECKVGKKHQSPLMWYEENAPIWSPSKKEKEHTFYQLDNVYIWYKGKGYRINPIFIQTTGE